MAKSSTSFAPGHRANPSGRPPLTPEQRRAREMRAQCQPEIVKALLDIATDSSIDVKDRIAAAKALLEDMPGDSGGGVVLTAFAELSRAQLEALARAPE